METGFKFDFSPFSLNLQKDKEIEQIPKLNTEPVRYENAEAMAKSIEWGKDYFALVSGSFVFGDLIEALLYHHELKPHAVYITTLGMNEENVDSIVNLCYLKAEKVNLIVSHYFAGVERNKLIPYIEQEIAGHPIDVAILQSHCKIVLIESDKGDAVITGSANLSSSNNVEQFIISHDAQMIAFCKARLENIMARFTVMRGTDKPPKMDWSNNKGNTGRHAWNAMALEG